MEMCTLLRAACVAFAVAGLLMASLAGSTAEAVSPHLWQPVPDDVYLQEVGSRILTDKPVTAVAVLGGTAYAVVDGAVKVVGDAALKDAPGAPSGVTRLKALDGALWASTDSGAYRYAGGAWTRVADGPFVDLCSHLGSVYGATKDAIYRFENGRFVDIKPEGGYLSNSSTTTMEDFTQVLADPVRIGPIDRIASYSGTLYMLGPRGLSLLDGKMYWPDPYDWGSLPSRTTRDMLADGSRLCIATDRGMAELRGMALTTVRGSDRLPYEDTTCLARGFDHDLWIGTTCGAIRQVGADFQYFGAQNWLPGANVLAIASGDRVVYIATDTGLAVIRYEPYTLEKKAAWYQREMNDWHFRRLGFTHTLHWSDKDGWIREISDNDGGHTAAYLAAMCFKYAVTKDEQARKDAIDAFNAMAWLGDITGGKGFIARAIWSVKADKGQLADRGSGGLPAKWNRTSDGLWLWKGDTSSDEVNGHMYAVSLFHDLVATGRDKARAADHLARTAGYIMDNGWKFIDADGKPTRWGRWDPDYLLKAYGSEAAGLNGI